MSSLKLPNAQSSSLFIIRYSSSFFRVAFISTPLFRSARGMSQRGIFLLGINLITMCVSNGIAVKSVIMCFDYFEVLL